MNGSLGLLMLRSLLLLIGVAMGGGVGSADVTPAPGDIRIQMSGESLTVQAHDAPLDEVVRKIGTLAGFKVNVAILLTSH
jgi:hypothetical protein